MRRTQKGSHNISTQTQTHPALCCACQNVPRTKPTADGPPWSLRNPPRECEETHTSPPP
ncbi:hypothetical protein CCM_03076 [Cordyceps militaris CM01]|uniref:Uncharacterized protein n=1 Tax=Cordyceps militaris (strain CM01) TaxID=983644 RepID=G3J8L8_CORMM|nr:uncharacterized protein CCM_03076 [Cordyceps militaris CM01]EGX94805.1 hypothetical protein CCM_03076 [Cordyceps militaris CM01]